MFRIIIYNSKALCNNEVSKKLPVKKSGGKKTSKTKLVSLLQIYLIFYNKELKNL